MKRTVCGWSRVCSGEDGLRRTICSLVSPSDVSYGRKIHALTLLLEPLHNVSERLQVLMSIIPRAVNRIKFTYIFDCDVVVNFLL